MADPLSLLAATLAWVPFHSLLGMCEIHPLPSRNLIPQSRGFQSLGWHVAATTERAGRTDDRRRTHHSAADGLLGGICRLAMQAFRFHPRCEQSSHALNLRVAIQCSDQFPLLSLLFSSVNALHCCAYSLALSVSTGR